MRCDSRVVAESEVANEPIVKAFQQRRKVRPATQQRKFTCLGRRAAGRGRSGGQARAWRRPRAHPPVAAPQVRREDWKNKKALKVEMVVQDLEALRFLACGAATG